MRYAGGILVIIAGSALGMSAGKDLRQRYHSWMELKFLIEILKGELQYASDPLHEIFQRLGERSNGCFARFFAETAESMAQVSGCPLLEILQEKSAVCLKTSGLSRREQDQLIRICAMIGQMDRISQAGVLNGYLFTIQQEEKIAFDKVKQKETMYRCLGLMGGLFFAILLY